MKLNNATLIFLSVFWGTFTISARHSHAVNKTPTTKECELAMTSPQPTNALKLIKVDPKTYAFKGLTPEGIEVLKKARDTIRNRRRLFHADLLNMSTLYHAGELVRLARMNMMLEGPHGGAKSAFVRWFLSGEDEAPFALQMHQMITEQALVGGQNFEAAKQGRFEVNVKGSLADHVVGLIDEGDKANPATLTSLMSLLNPDERDVQAGGQTFKAKTQTIFSTSNATLPQLMQQFIDSGQRTSGRAYANRFQVKAKVSNWLQPGDQAVIDQRSQKKNYLMSIASSYPEALESEVFLKPAPVDWASLRAIAGAMFKGNSLFWSSYSELSNSLRLSTKKVQRESETRFLNNPQEEPFQYTPTADWSERLRKQIPNMILASAFLDYLESPLAEDHALKSLDKQIELDPLSLWRGFLGATKIENGTTQLVYDPKNKESPLDIVFPTNQDILSAESAEEQLDYKYNQDEQKRFRDAYLEIINTLSKEIELSSRMKEMLNKKDNPELSFELQLLQATRGR